MPIYRTVKNRNNPYVMLNKFFLSDNRLSLKAKGLLTYLLSKPDDWRVYEFEIVGSSKDSRDSVRTAIKELVDVGYIERQRLRDEKGQLRESAYNVYEVPQEMREGKTKVGQFLNAFSAGLGVQRNPLPPELIKRLEQEMGSGFSE